VIPLEIDTLTAVLDGRVVASTTGEQATSAVVEVMTDSRVRSAGPAVFFALRTERADGHDHVSGAQVAGATVAIVERVVPGATVTQIVVGDTWAALGRLARHVLDVVGCRVVAITGSYGKTTVKDLAAAALSPSHQVAASRASFNNELGVPLTMLSVDASTEVLVAEAGARNAGDIGLLGDLLRPDVSVVTAVGPVHLETFGDEQGVASEKSRLVRALRPTGTAVLNVDDARVAAMARLAPATLTVSAAGDAADVRAERSAIDPEGRVHALAVTPWGTTELSLPLPGSHHLGNALLALAVAGLHGVAPARAAAAIATAPTSPSRSVVQRIGGVTVFDDAYNASPPTVLGALRTLRALPCEGRRWAVLGVMAELGDGSEEQHQTVGRACSDAVDELVVVGEGAVGIATGAGAAGSLRVRTVPDHAAAAALVTAEVAPGDVVLFKASRVATLDRAAASLLAALSGADVR
jgi:UDP-N-acetylmuramoyl-tripeptide--D-alanyl-D-alanine ligase